MKTLLMVLLLGVVQLASAQELRELFVAGKTAYDSADYQKALESFVRFDEIRSNYPPVNAYLAMIYSRTGNPKSSRDYLVKTAIINADTSLLAREDFAPIRSSKDFREVTQLFMNMLDSVQRSELAFKLEDPGIHPETLAFDPENSRFYIGSVRKRQILIYESGRFYEFKAPAEDGLLAVTGLAVDRDARVLWASSAYMKQMEKQEAGVAGSAVHAFDMDTGEVLFSHRITDEDVLFGDLVLDKNGLPYMTNSITPEIYRANADSAWQWQAFPELINLQGLTTDENGGLFFSDYILGIYHLEDGKLKRIAHDTYTSTKGIDGLYYRNGNLIALQNGVYPMRVSQFTLNKSRSEIEKVVYLDKNNSDLNEPVQGTWVGDWFYFISNSPWRYYDKDSRLKPEGVPRTQVRRVNLIAN